MLTTLDAVVDRIVAGYDPDRIILFGSRATGTAAPDSDIDLLIVKDTDERPIDRRMAVERLLADRGVALDLLVYTPREMRELYAIGSPLIEEIVEHGRVLYMRKATAAWLGDARDELESAVVLRDRDLHRGACLHAQQCVEKVLKALVLEKGHRPRRTHDIVELLAAAAAEHWDVPLAMDDAVFLNSIYRGRYPTEEGLLPHGEATQDDATRAVTVATNVMEWVGRRVL